jgi:hypothetical protein
LKQVGRRDPRDERREGLPVATTRRVATRHAVRESAGIGDDEPDACVQLARTGVATLRSAREKALRAATMNPFAPT